MLEALRLAKQAAARGEVPVGAVIVKDKIVIAEGQNRREQNRDALAHAEIEAIADACRRLHRWRLDDCDLYVTLEPCPMCAGAIINARIRRIYFGAYDSKAGSLGSLTDLSVLPYNHKPEVYGGIMEAPCREMLAAFFLQMRLDEKNTL